MSTLKSLLSSLPPVDQLLKEECLQNYHHEFKKEICRSALEKVRKEILSEYRTTLPENWVEILLEQIDIISSPKLRRVINATGIVIHTNLGRAPLHPSSVENVQNILSGYSNVEIQLDSGKRGGRLSGIQERICKLTGAEDCIVVNNNAAATLLAVSAIAQGKEIVVSRGELVEIGGSFRVPDVIFSGGAIMVEVGCTNKTRVSDFVEGSTPETAAYLRVHTSNFKMVGFVQTPDRRTLAKEAQKRNIALIEDLGSGLLADAPNIPNARILEEQESVKRAIADGVDLITFSGDKLLGGVQAGFIVGKKSLVQRCRKHPLYRALRCCKLTYAALESLLILYERQEQHDIPVWKMLERTEQECRQQAEELLKELKEKSTERNIPSRFSIKNTKNYSGGGALPAESLGSHALVWEGIPVEMISKNLRTGTPSVLARIHDDSLFFEMRTILDHRERDMLRDRIIEVLEELENGQIK